MTMIQNPFIQNTVLALREVDDPEIGVNLVDLGLVYGIQWESTSQNQMMIRVQMTLTSPSCPLGQWIAESTENKIKEKTGIPDVKVELVFEPRWKPEMMSESAKKTF